MLPVGDTLDNSGKGDFNIADSAYVKFLFLQSREATINFNNIDNNRLNNFIPLTINKLD